MQVKGKVVVVTGGANGIGRALARAFAAEGARGVVIADLDEKGAQQVTSEIKATAVIADVSKPTDVSRLVDRTTAQFGRVDIFCSNAGIGAAGGPEAPDPTWERSWQINVMAHVYAARAVLLKMKKGALQRTTSKNFKRRTSNNGWRGRARGRFARRRERSAWRYSRAFRCTQGPA